jgi:hypothetical protein
MNAGQAMTYAASPKGTQAAFRAMSRNLDRFRRGETADLKFSEADRQEQTDAGAKQNGAS